jgi:hypothetical protein
VALSRSRVAAVGLFAVLACGAGSSAVLPSELDGAVSRAAAIAVTGPVLVRHGVADFVPAREGDVVAAGDTIRTGSGASVVITYIEGSTVRVEGDAEIVVASLRTTGGAQTLGRAWHVITALVSGSSRYEMRGASATASVRG